MALINLDLYAIFNEFVDIEPSPYVSEDYFYQTGLIFNDRKKYICGVETYAKLGKSLMETIESTLP